MSQQIKMLEAYVINYQGILSIVLVSVVALLILLLLLKLFKVALWVVAAVIVIPFLLVLCANSGVELLSKFPPETSAKIEDSYEHFFEDAWKTTGDTMDLIERGNQT